MAVTLTFTSHVNASNEMQSDPDRKVVTLGLHKRDHNLKKKYFSPRDQGKDFMNKETCMATKIHHKTLEDNTVYVTRIIV